MTALLGGRTVRTLVTSLEVLSNDESAVLMLDRQEDGSVVIKTRKPYESAWGSDGPRFEIKASDARILGAMLQSQDQSYLRSTLDEIPAADFTRDKPAEVVEAELREKIGDCTELDIERAKAENLKEQRRNIELEMERDHALDKHVGFRIDGCPACGQRISPGYGDGSARKTAEESERYDPTAEETDLPAEENPS